MATTISRPLIAAPRTAVLTSADLSFRQRLRDTLTELRWQVREAAGGAEVLAHLDAAPADALIADFSSGAPSATSVADLASLSQSLNYVDQQRAVIDNSINRLTASSNYASSESVQLQSAARRPTADGHRAGGDAAQHGRNPTGIADPGDCDPREAGHAFRHALALPGAKRGTLFAPGRGYPPPPLFLYFVDSMRVKG